jgi:hypothetical protein
MYTYMYNYYNYLQPCALNAHFHTQMIENLLTLRTSLKRG